MSAKGVPGAPRLPKGNVAAPSERTLRRRIYAQWDVLMQLRGEEYVARMMTEANWKTELEQTMSQVTLLIRGKLKAKGLPTALPLRPTDSRMTEAQAIVSEYGL